MPMPASANVIGRIAGSAPGASLRDDERREDADGHAERVEVERLALVHHQHREHQDDERRRDAQQDEFEVAPRHAPSPLRATSSALSALEPALEGDVLWEEASSAELPDESEP